MEPFAELAPEQRDTAARAWADAFGRAPIDRTDRIRGGSSGAVLIRIEAGGRLYLLRSEGPATALLPRNPHRHACTRAAAEAGVAPALHLIDESAGMMILDWIEARPLSSFPGGAAGFARALGELLHRLQAARPFPRLVYYPDLLTRMLIQVAELFELGSLTPHLEQLAELRGDYDLDLTPGVSSHNDPNPDNILFDGERLWLIDWEAGYRNDPLVDVSIVLDNLAGPPEIEGLLLAAWGARPADDDLRSRLTLVRRLTRLYYALFLLNAAPPTGAQRLSVLRPPPQATDEALQAFRQGKPTPEATRTLGMAYLEGFLTGAPASELTRGLASAG